MVMRHCPSSRGKPLLTVIIVFLLQPGRIMGGSGKIDSLLFPASEGSGCLSVQYGLAVCLRASCFTTLSLSFFGS